MTNNKILSISTAKVVAIKFVLLGFLLAQETFAMKWTEINLTVTDIDVKRGGEIVVLVFEDKGFPTEHDKALKTYTFDTKNIQKSVKIAVPDSVFALKIHHDEDKSGAVTKDQKGIMPVEGIGFSSGAKIRSGPPSFEAARTQLPENGEITIAIKYP
jgi:uncharacterized protein (DUF2141 family)